MPIEHRSVKHLREHALQRALFFELSSDEITARREVIQQSGLTQALEILPDGTVLSGYKWLVAAKLEGQHEVNVLVRNDLAERGNADVVEAFIRTNLSCEKVSNIEKAGCFAEYRRVCSHHHLHGDGDTRDRIARFLNLGLSGRELDRLVPLLKLPVEIRQAIAKKRISKIAGTRILALPKDEQLQIAANVAANKPWRQISKDYGVAAFAAEGSMQAKLTGLPFHLRELARYLDDDNVELVLSAAVANQLIESAEQLKQSVRRRRQKMPSKHGKMPPLPPNVSIRPAPVPSEQAASWPDRSSA